MISAPPEVKKTDSTPISPKNQRREVDGSEERGGDSREPPGAGIIFVQFPAF
jgi:hypothetical protein